MQKLLILLAMVLSLSCQANTTIKLNERNHAFFDTEVDRNSVAIILSELQRKDKLLSPSEDLYLVLKTPGGSVIHGMFFINAIKHLKHKLHTITIVSASMGFQIVQASPGKRYILNTGIIMTHPIAGGCEGRPGAIAACLGFMIQLAESLDRIASERMGMSLESYQKQSSEEWWAVGQGALDFNMADEIVSIQCDSNMNFQDRCPY